MKITIEQATIEDIAAILELQRLAYQKEAERYNDYEIPPLTQPLDALVKEYKNTLFLKLVVDGKLIGSVKGIKERTTCHIGRLMVHPDYQGRGYGKKLMQTIEAEFLKDKSVNRFELFTGALSLDNIGLYRSLGYKQFKVTPFGNGYDIVYLEKTVN
jgi:ribosomal protein S18 acetylase RimI-like enzyme